MSHGEFSVAQFFPSGAYEYTRRYVSAEEAMNAAVHYCTSVAAKADLTRRVILTDGGDCITFEWRHDTGVIFPEEFAGWMRHGDPDCPPSLIDSPA